MTGTSNCICLLIFSFFYFQVDTLNRVRATHTNILPHIFVNIRIFQNKNKCVDTNKLIYVLHRYCSQMHNAIVFLCTYMEMKDLWRGECMLQFVFRSQLNREYTKTWSTKSSEFQFFFLKNYTWKDGIKHVFNTYCIWSSWAPVGWIQCIFGWRCLHVRAWSSPSGQLKKILSSRIN